MRSISQILTILILTTLLRRTTAYGDKDLNIIFLRNGNIQTLKYGTHDEGISYCNTALTSNMISIHSDIDFNHWKAVFASALADIQATYYWWPGWTSYIWASVYDPDGDKIWYWTDGTPNDYEAGWIWDPQTTHGSACALAHYNHNPSATWGYHTDCSYASAGYACQVGSTRGSVPRLTTDDLTLVTTPKTWQDAENYCNI